MGLPLLSGFRDAQADSAVLGSAVATGKAMVFTHAGGGVQCAHLASVRAPWGACQSSLPTRYFDAYDLTLRTASVPAQISAFADR
jgi:hypothetical protein